MTAKNMSELNRMLMHELNKAMNVASEKALADTHEETAKFYTKGNPKHYVRTGALGDTPRTTPVISSSDALGGKVEFDVYLDQLHDYTTGTFDMPMVLERAESTHFRSGILGKPKFWEGSEKKMNKTIERTLRKFFK